MRSRILIGLLLGAVGGLIGWLLQENLINYNAYVVKDVVKNVCNQIDPPLVVANISRISICLFIGLFLGGVDGVVEGNSTKLKRGIVIGAIGAFIIGAIGWVTGDAFYHILGGRTSNAPDPSLFAYVRQMLARGFDFAFKGLGIGTGAALATLSPKRIRNGAIGGIIGGFIAGLIFDLLPSSLFHIAFGAGGCIDQGGAGRAVGWTAIGALTGFFIGLVDELLKQAWVRVLSGRNEGKDFILSKAMNLLGRDERCDVPLFGDTSIGAQHAAIRADGNRHVLIDAGTPSGTIVNGQKVDPSAELLLRDGDMIQIGSQRILFREKATQSRVASSPVDAPRAKPAGGSGVSVPAHVCPYCGAPKKADGSCLCTLDAGGAVQGGFASPPAYDPMTNYGGQPPQTAPSSPIMGVQSALPSRIIGTEGAYYGQVFPLNPNAPELSVGREPGRDILLSAEVTVSRNHARLAIENGMLVVYDLASANGTFVNGIRISAQPVSVGDTVQFGASKFRLE